MAYVWDYSKIPKMYHNLVLDLFEKDDIKELMIIHNEFRVSPVDYCCDEIAVRKHFKHGIDKGLIFRQVEIF